MCTWYQCNAGLPVLSITSIASLKSGNHSDSCEELVGLGTLHIRRCSVTDWKHEKCPVEQCRLFERMNNVWMAMLRLMFKSFSLAERESTQRRTSPNKTTFVDTNEICCSRHNGVFVCDICLSVHSSIGRSKSTKGIANIWHQHS
jgi:hypothetical protein